MEHFGSQTYFTFSAQRYSIGTCAYGQHERLTTMLTTLRESFHGYGDLSVAPSVNAASLEILVWPTKQLQRELQFRSRQPPGRCSPVIAISTIAMTFSQL